MGEGTLGLKQTPKPGRQASLGTCRNLPPGRGAVPGVPPRAGILWQRNTQKGLSRVSVLENNSHLDISEKRTFQRRDLSQTEAGGGAGGGRAPIPGTKGGAGRTPLPSRVSSLGGCSVKGKAPGPCPAPGPRSPRPPGA